MSSERTVWDAGLQPERTRLAWQRTSLALLTAGLVVARFVGHNDMGAGVAIAAISTLLAGAVGIMSTRRYRRLQDRLHDESPLPGGLVNLLMTIALLIVGVGAVGYVLLS